MPHNGLQGYPIRSLYFDTLHDRDYAEKLMGTDPRRKVRLRVYDPSGDFALLELKQKQGDNQRKRSLPVTREEARRRRVADARRAVRRRNACAHVHQRLQPEGHRGV